jgi:hypothetical protein
MTHRLLLALAVLTSTASAVDYRTQISPIFRNKCYACHSVTKKVKGKLALDDNKITEQIGAGKHIIPGEPMKSTLFISCTLPDDDTDVMPPDGKNRLSDAEVTTLKTWITEGAALAAGAAAPAAVPTASAPATGGDGPLLKWTTSDGRTKDAHFMGLQGDSVLLKFPDTGTTHIFPLAKLSAESQAQAKSSTK